MSKLGIPELTDTAVLKAIWKKSIRRRLRTTRFKDMELARDPLDFLGLERLLDTAIEELAQQLRGGGYRPRAPEWIRAAKRVGLTRPLAFLSPRDQLTYRALVALAENDLLAGSAPWTRLGRADAGNEEDDSVTLAESGWFRSWLRREGQLWVIDENHDWLVESDVSNFFPSVQISDVCAFVQDNSRLGIGLVRLLEYILQVFSPMAAYRPSRVGGLPQEGFDVSRVLAHLYLRPLDDEFTFEGKSDRYSRWVDDVVVGADSWDEALRMVQRIQTTLEGLGLYANAAKTRIVPAAQFRLDYMKDENDWIGDFEEAQKTGTGDKIEFRRRLRLHLSLEDRPKGWPRVLRRFYTNSRRLGDPYLVDRWPAHMELAPDSARSIFDYLSTFRLTGPRFRRLLEALDRFGAVYEDIEILAHEYVTTSPTICSVALADSIANWAMDVVRREADVRPRVAAAACVTLGKFGNTSLLDDLGRLHDQWRQDTVVRTQATVVLFATGRLNAEHVSRLLSRSQLETIETLEFLLALSDGERQAVGMAISAMEPVRKRDPDRYVIKPRMSFLAPLVQAADPRRWGAVWPGWYARAAGIAPGLRDYVGERWLFG